MLFFVIKETYVKIGFFQNCFAKKGPKETNFVLKRTNFEIEIFPIHQAAIDSVKTKYPRSIVRSMYIVNKGPRNITEK